LKFQLFVKTYQLVEPSIKEKDVVYESLTYSSELYISAGLIWKNSRDILEQIIFIGNIPLMNSLETSIVNRIYRIVINQILQSPTGIVGLCNTIHPTIIFKLLFCIHEAYSNSHFSTFDFLGLSNRHLKIEV